MKKSYKLRDLDCANCAAKMEDAIKKLDGVEDASISFMAQRLSVELDGARHEEIMQDIAKAIKKIEPDCALVM